MRRCQERWAQRSCARSISRGREQEQWRGRACSPVFARTCEDPQRLLGTAIWNHSGIPKSAAGLDGGALFQSSSTPPRRSHCLHACERQCRALVSTLISEDATTQIGVDVVKRCVCGCQGKKKKKRALSWTRPGDTFVQSVRRVPEEQRYGNKLLESVRGTPWQPEPNPGDVSTDLIIPQMTDVEPTPTRVYNSDNRGTRKVCQCKINLEKFGYTAGCRACEVHRAGQPMFGQEHTAKCRKRLEGAMETNTSTATRVKATSMRQAERIIKDLHESGTTNPNSSSGSGQHKRVRFSDQEPVG